jgi:CHAD domain-containing protein
MQKKLKVEWNPEATAQVNARTHLPLLAEDYFRAGRALLGGKHPAKVMHKLRLRTKHFRYTLELFRDVYGKGMEKRLELLKPLQDLLGDLNDCVTARGLLDGEDPTIKSYLKKRTKRKISEFEQHWREVFDAPGQSEAWLEYLATGKAN